MTDDAGPSGTGAQTQGPSSTQHEAVAVVIQELLSAVPAGWLWLTPVRARGGRVTDFRIEAVSGEDCQTSASAVERIGSLVGQRYPGLVGGPVWEMYTQVLATGVPGRVVDFCYEENRPKVIARSQFVVSARRVHGGLLVGWDRVDESKRRLEYTERVGNLGWAEYDLVSGVVDWSAGMYRILERDPAEGPMSRTQQADVIVSRHRGGAVPGWATPDGVVVSDVTVRMRFGDTVKHVRMLSDVTRDSAGEPLKIYTIAQDVTGREASNDTISRLRRRLLSQAVTAQSQHSVSLRVQEMIQPVPSKPLRLADLDAIVLYEPAERRAKVGGDWYCAQNLPNGQVALAIGDVAGHGLEAAGGMAHLRFSLIAWLSIGILDPGTLLSHLNRLSVLLGITGTAMIAVYDPADRALSWARAGHLPPLLARAGMVVELAQPSGILLGTNADLAHPVVVSRLWANDLVVLYTDGLVERRPDDTDEPFIQITKRLSEMSAAQRTLTLPRLRALVPRKNPDDDTCVLAIQVRAAP